MHDVVVSLLGLSQIQAQALDLAIAGAAVIRQGVDRVIELFAGEVVIGLRRVLVGLLQSSR